MFIIIKKNDGVDGRYKYVAANYETTLFYADALIFETEDSARTYLYSLRKGCTFYNNYFVSRIGEEPTQLDMFAITNPPDQIKPKTKNPI
jgi:hypothetical protein